MNGLGVLLLFAELVFPVISWTAVSLGSCLVLSESACVHVISLNRFLHANSV